MFDAIKPTGPVVETPSLDDLQEESAVMGVVLPPSYVDWCTRFGRGVLDDLLAFWVPVRRIPDRLSVMCDGAGVVVEDVRSGHAEFPPDGSEAIALRLVYFGHSFNGELFAWDFEDREGEEPAIYCVGRASWSFCKAGYGMGNLVRSLLSEDVRRVMGPGYAPLLGRFVPSPSITY